MMNGDAKGHWLDRVRDWPLPVRGFVVALLLCSGYGAAVLAVLMPPSTPTLLGIIVLFGVLPLAVLGACIVSFVTRQRVPYVGVGWGIGLYLLLGMLVLPWIESGPGPIVPLWPGWLVWDSYCDVAWLPCPT